jgi:hypothetical protein
MFIKLAFCYLILHDEFGRTKDPYFIGFAQAKEMGWQVK